MADPALVVPESTVPGTRAWAETVAANARRYAGFTEKDVRPLVDRYRQLVEHEAWELWYPGQSGARSQFLTEVLGYNAEFLDTMSRGVEILDGHGHHGPVPQDVAQRAVALDGKTINKGDGRLSEEEKANGHIMPVKANGAHGTNADYLTRRIARDHPEILDRMKAGEFRSVHAAAIEAGIAARTRSVRIDDPESVARTLRNCMPPEALLCLAELLTKED